MHARAPRKNFAKPRAASTPARRHLILPGGKGLEVFGAAHLAPVGMAILAPARLQQDMENTGDCPMQEELQYALLYDLVEQNRPGVFRRARCPWILNKSSGPS